MRTRIGRLKHPVAAIPRLKIFAWLNHRNGDHQPVQGSLKQAKQYLLTGVSCVVPLIACGLD
jgi:hypothetical protein